MSKAKINDLKQKIIYLEDINISHEKRLAEFHSLFQKMNSGIAFLEPLFNEKKELINCRFLDINPVYEKMAGIRKNDIIGKEYLSVFPHTPNAVIATFSEVFRKNISKSIDFTYNPSNTKFSIHVSNIGNGKLSLIITNSSWLKGDLAKNKITGVGQTDKELRITNKKLRIGTQIIQYTNQRLKENEERFRTLVENSPDIFFRYDKNFRHVYVSPNVYTILGKNPEDLLGKTHDEIECTSSESHRWREKLKKVFEEGAEEDLEFFCENTGKKMVFLSWKLTPEYRDDGKIVSVLGIARDITLRKQAEDDLLRAKKKAEEAENLKSAFLANMSHEIRTPMNGILGFSELLSNENIDPEKRKLFSKIINNNGKQLLRIIDDIIDVSKLEAGEIIIVKTKCQLNVLLEELFSLFKSDNITKKKNIELTLKKGLSDIKSYIFIDEMRLRQVLINLVGNATKFTEKGTVDIGYDFFDGKNELRFYIKDTGIGISEEDKEIIFERFRQVDETISKDYGGTGLGLPISKGFVELMGGRIWFENNPGGGTTFFFTIPYRPIRQEDEIKKLSSEVFDQDWKGKTILVVEDEESSFIFLETLLNATGVNILHAKNGQEAVDYAMQYKHLDLILMDVQLPVLNGYEATKKIREFKKDVPIISQTAYALSGEKEKSLKSGCNDYITKPINRYLLFEKLNKFLSPL